MKASTDQIDRAAQSGMLDTDGRTIGGGRLMDAATYEISGGVRSGVLDGGGRLVVAG
jgi:hypothetical protein